MVFWLIEETENAVRHAIGINGQYISHELIQEESANSFSKFHYISANFDFMHKQHFNCC